jgi:hypothetical protein
MATEVAKLKKSESVTVRTTTEERMEKRPPKGATIVSKSETTSSEQIENGWLITKSYDISYKLNKESGTDYCYYTKKWYSKDDPMMNNKGKALYDLFDDEE